VSGPRVEAKGTGVLVRSEGAEASVETSDRIALAFENQAGLVATEVRRNRRGPRAPSRPLVDYVVSFTIADARLFAEVLLRQADAAEAHARRLQ
jgi:hypothetical protein